MSITETDIQKLAALSRIKLSKEELGQFAKEIESILHYVEQIKEVSSNMSVDSSGKTPSEISHRNFLREDIENINLNPDAAFVIKEAPSVEGGYIKVKKILG